MLSIYYDRHGHTYYTVTDLNQRVTRSVRVTLSSTPLGPVEYTMAWLYARVDTSVTPPPARDTRLWQFTGIHLTTYSGTRGTMLGPWTTSKIIETSTGASTGTVVASPSALQNYGQDFGVWLRPLPLAYTSAFAGYADSTGPFRFISTALTVPARHVPPANGGAVLVALGHNGGVTPRPYANIEVLPGGGAGSISYTCNAASGRFTVNPKPGDRVTVSIYYDQKGHYSFTAADTTQGTGQTVSAAARYAGQMPLNSAEVLGMISNAAVTTPRADIRLWQFTGIRVTTYNGTRGGILGPWATSEWIDTTGGTPAGAVVMSASTLSNGSQDFSVWLRRRS
jgi:Peptidase A4 family